MGRLRFLTAGESHGPGLTTIVEGVPFGMKLVAADIDPQLARRQAGYGRGGRMKIEKDQVVIRSGVRHGFTLGSPITLLSENRDWTNWREKMAVEPIDGKIPPITKPGFVSATTSRRMRSTWPSRCRMSRSSSTRPIPEIHRMAARSTSSFPMATSPTHRSPCAG